MQNCEWVIAFPQNERISLAFLAFDLEFQSMCKYDWLEVRDGNSSDSTMIGHQLCGDKVPESITSTGNTLFIRFSSDGSGIKTGFEINVTISNVPGICFKQICMYIYNCLHVISITIFL